jgi:hypothetical protein
VSLYDLVIPAAVLWLIYKGVSKFLWPKADEPAPTKDVVEPKDDFIVQMFRAWWKRHLARNEYTELNPKYFTAFTIERSFTAKTLLDFKVQYGLNLLVQRVDDEEFKRHRMLDDYSRQQLAEEFNEEVFLGFMNDESCFFSIATPSAIEPKEIYEAFRTPIYQLVEDDETFAREFAKTTFLKDGGRFVREFAKTSFQVGVGKIPFTKNGCKITSGYLEVDHFPDELIEENYAMLTNEQKAAILADKDFGILDETLAVAALKRRLEFFGGSSKQRHENNDLFVETERAGRGLRIRWRFKKSDIGYELLGYRKTDGFCADPWDEKNNGSLVIHADGSGEVIEFLNIGEANFYTLVMQLRSRQENSVEKSSSLRFQVTVAPEKETEAIEAALRRAEQRAMVVDPVDPARENMSQALKELGLVMEFDEAIDEMEKSLIERIRAKNLPKDEEEEKIEFVRDAARLQRDKYQP